MTYISYQHIRRHQRYDKRPKGQGRAMSKIYRAGKVMERAYSRLTRTFRRRTDRALRQQY